MLTYVIPTRDRPQRLTRTLEAIGALRGHVPGETEIIVVDNRSTCPPTVPPTVGAGIPVRLIRRDSNEGAASRTAGVLAADPRTHWIVMLDDDSHPVDTGFIRRLGCTPPDVAAVAADIYLPGLARRESGGLPEVFIGCGVAIRRDVYLTLGGYDPAFNYYAEEYDLAAKMILHGYRVHFDPWFRVEHHKVAAGRDMDTILARLVRNNGWVMQRYAPDTLRRWQLRLHRRRYRRIAALENALAGYRAGLLELRRTRACQPRNPMPVPLFERFTGVAYAREALQAAYNQRPFRTVTLVDEGKNAWVVRHVLMEMGIRVLESPPAEPGTAGGSATGDRIPDAAEALVIGTMSPGPMLDAWERRTLRCPVTYGPRVIAPWRVVGAHPRLSWETVLTSSRGPVGEPPGASGHDSQPAAERRASA